MIPIYNPKNNIYIIKDKQNRVKYLIGKEENLSSMVDIARANIEKPKNSEIMKSIEDICKIKSESI